MNNRINMTNAIHYLNQKRMEKWTDKEIKQYYIDNVVNSKIKINRLPIMTTKIKSQTCAYLNQSCEDFIDDTCIGCEYLIDVNGD